MTRAPAILVVAFVALAGGTARAQDDSAGAASSSDDDALLLRGKKIASRAELYHGEPELSGWQPPAESTRADSELYREAKTKSSEVDETDLHARMLAIYEHRTPTRFPEPAALKVPRASGADPDAATRPASQTRLLTCLSALAFVALGALAFLKKKKSAA